MYKGHDFTLEAGPSDDTHAQGNESLSLSVTYG